MPILNAGSGKDQHPTQALLDIYTLERSFKENGGIDGKTIGMMGDLKRGRTVRSLCYLMKNYRNVRLVFIAPDDFAMGDDIKKSLQSHGVEFGRPRTWKPRCRSWTPSTSRASRTSMTRTANPKRWTFPSTGWARSI